MKTIKKTLSGFSPLRQLLPKEKRSDARDYHPSTFADFGKRSIFVSLQDEENFIPHGHAVKASTVKLGIFTLFITYRRLPLRKIKSLWDGVKSSCSSVIGDRFFVRQKLMLQDVMNSSKKTFSLRQLLNIVLLGCMSISLLFVGASYSGVPKWAALALNLSFGVLFLLSFVFMLVANSAKKGGEQ